MLFNKLVIHNFGIYQGRHEIDLSPKNNKPIILIGALNGSGKTTFLDALQLVLYGKHAKCSGRIEQSYKDFLRSSINRYCSPAEGAGLEITFEHMHDGEIQIITVKRTWSQHGAGINEQLEVFSHGVLDAVLSEQWQEYVEDYIPSSISELFFFDGEKIEALADLNSSAKIIKTGIHSLLGLNIIDKLGADLRLLQKAKLSKEISIDQRSELDLALNDISQVEKSISSLTLSIAEQTTIIDGFNNKQLAQQNKYIQLGGLLAEKESEIRAKIKEVEFEYNERKNELLTIAAGGAPFLMALSQITRLIDRVEIEDLNKNNHIAADRVIEHDKKLIKFINTHISDKVSKTTLIEYINDQIAGLKSNATNDHPIAINLANIQHFNNGYFANISSQMNIALSSLERHESALSDAERKIQSIPSTEVTTELKSEIVALEESLSVEKAKKSIFEQELQSLKNMLEKAHRKYALLQSNYAQELSGIETNQRIINNIEKIQWTITEYRNKVLQRNLIRLSEIIYNCFIKITRKNESYSTIKLSSDDYSLSLFDKRGILIPTSKLSAGERQVLAISILWGLSKASGKELPTIIDTPLGRLDGKVRPKLAKEYFPYASRQTIILSTDEEINEKYYPTLKKYIAREYLIEHSESLNTSKFTAGYFDFTKETV